MDRLHFIFDLGTLRDIESALYVRRSTLSDACAKRSSGFFLEVCRLMINKIMVNTHSRRLRQAASNLLAVDSTTCLLSKYLGRHMRFRMGGAAGVKAHIVYNVNGDWIEDLRITPQRVADLSTAKQMDFCEGKTYVFDRAYVNFVLWEKIEKGGANFVTRLKRSKRLFHIHKAQVNLAGVGVLYDGKWCIGESTGARAGLRSSQYKNKFYRIVVYRDPETKKLFDFVTSDFVSSAQSIADIYKKRWAVELLFKWLKGHLHIRALPVRSVNGVETYLIIALLTHILLALVRETAASSENLTALLRILKSGVYSESHILQGIGVSGPLKEATAKTLRE